MIELKKVVKRGDKYCVVHCHGKEKEKVIKCFPTKEQADKMHQAIQANKSMTDTEAKSLDNFYTDSIATEVVETKTGKEYFITGYISTHDRDLVDDIVTENCMEDMLTQIKSGNIKIDIDHATWRGKSKEETEANKTINPIARIVDAARDVKGIWIKALMNKASPRFQEAWDSVQNKFLTAFSIAYIAQKAITKSLMDGTVRLLDKVKLLNVALTGNPINTGATISEVFTKSLNNLKEAEMEKKSYEKDGAHAHTELSPLGEHNHKEIENVISGIQDRLWKLEYPPETSTDTNIIGKSKTEAKMADEEKPDTPADKPEDKPEDIPTDKPEDTPAPADKPEGETEVKALTKELKSLTEKVDALTKEQTELKAKLAEPQYKSKVENPKDFKDAPEAKAKGPLDMVA